VKSVILFSFWIITKRQKQAIWSTNPCG